MIVIVVMAVSFHYTTIAGMSALSSSTSSKNNLGTTTTTNQYPQQKQHQHQPSSTSSTIDCADVRHAASFDEPTNNKSQIAGTIVVSSPAAGVAPGGIGAVVNRRPSFKFETNNLLNRVQNISLSKASSSSSSTRSGLFGKSSTAANNSNSSIFQPSALRSTATTAASYVIAGSVCGGGAGGHTVSMQFMNIMAIRIEASAASASAMTMPGAVHHQARSTRAYSRRRARVATKFTATLHHQQQPEFQL